MRSRQLVLLSVVALVAWPAQAAQPQGTAGKLIANPLVDDFSCHRDGFELYQFFSPRVLDPADVVTLDFAVIPFRSGVTMFGLDDANGQTFFQLEFSGGLINGLRYKPAIWNDVSATLYPATQDYVLTVNGVQAGPFPFGDFCQDSGGCFTFQALRIHGFDTVGEDHAFTDSISLVQNADLIHEMRFDTCSVAGMGVAFGGVLHIPDAAKPNPRPSSVLIQRVPAEAP